MKNIAGPGHKSLLRERRAYNAEIVGRRASERRSLTRIVNHCSWAMSGWRGECTRYIVYNRNNNNNTTATAI